MEPGALGFGSTLAFDREYAIRATRKLASGRHYSEVVGYRRLDDLEARVARLSYRARAEDCLDLPPVVTKRVPVTLSPKQAKALEELKSAAMAYLDANAAFVDGRNVLSRYLRMAQVLGGIVGVLDHEGQAVDEPVAFDPYPKLDALREYLEALLDDPTQKAVIFCQFRAEIRAIAAMAEKWKPALMYGEVKDDAREAGHARFRADPETRLIVCQYQTGSKGLTLVEAATIVFYSLTFSLEDFLQARKRVHRIGQSKTVTEVYLLAQSEGRRGVRESLDHVILGALKEKKGLADIVTGDRAKSLLREVI